MTDAGNRQTERAGWNRSEMRVVAAIVRTSALETVERRLMELGVPGMTVTRVKGWGEYQNFFASDQLDEHARIEVFLSPDQADATARAIVEAARTGLPGDGIVAVLPVASVYRVRTGRLITGDLQPEGGAGSRSPGAPP